MKNMMECQFVCFQKCILQVQREREKKSRDLVFSLYSLWIDIDFMQIANEMKKMQRLIEEIWNLREKQRNWFTEKVMKKNTTNDMGHLDQQRLCCVG